MNESTTSREFSTEPSLRARHVALLFAKLLLAISAAYVGTRLIVGRPVLPIPVYLFPLAFLLPPVLCFGRTRWGSAIRFTRGGIDFLRQGTTILHIPRASIQSVRPGSNAISVRYTAEAASKIKVIGNEGFSKAHWQELRDYCNEYVVKGGNA